MNYSDYHIHIVNLDHMRMYLKNVKNELKNESIAGNIVQNPILSFPTHCYMFNFREIMDISEYNKIKIIPSFSLVTEEGIEITIFVFHDGENELLEIIQNERFRWIVFILEEISYKGYIINPYNLSKRNNKKFHEIEKIDIAEYLFSEEDNNFINLDEVNQSVLFEIFEEFPFKKFSIDYITNYKDFNCRYYLTGIDDEELLKKYKFDGFVHNDLNTLYKYKENGYSTFYGSGKNIYFMGSQEVDLCL